MEIIIDGFDFWGMVPQKYYAFTAAFKGDKKAKGLLLLGDSRRQSAQGRVHLHRLSRTPEESTWARRTGRLRGSRSRSSAAGFGCRKRIGNTSPTRGLRQSAGTAETLSARDSPRRIRRTTGSRRPCAGIPCSRRSTPAPAVAAAALKSGGKSRKERTSRQNASPASSIFS